MKSQNSKLPVTPPSRESSTSGFLGHLDMVTQRHTNTDRQTHTHSENKPLKKSRIKDAKSNLLYADSKTN